MNGEEKTLPEDMLPAERRQRLIDWFDANFAGTSQDLAKKFNISVSTIRRDLDQLSEEGFLRRTHGGAVRTRQHTTYEPSTDLARRTAVAEKEAIVEEAIRQIVPGQSILIDTGTVSHVFADAVASLEFHLTIITNDLYVANVLTYKPQFKLIVPGGDNRPGAFDLQGERGISFLNDIRCDLFFMSAQAVDAECASDTVLQLVELKRAMVEAAE
ncbi:MAG: DeoR/GlpR family DNA-binding transcription regulator, partial [Rhodospirillales bacterium]|nr:DeoR/GlpR family DNA-binding transcription regulator [Rhodospirillales bacterium]